MTVPAAVLDMVWARDESRCFNCTRGLVRGMGDYSVHHRRARGMGGSKRGDTNTPANLLLLCGTGTTGCHGMIEQNRVWAYAAGLLVHNWRDPADVPVRRWMTTYATLGHDGTIRSFTREEVN